MKKLEIYLLIGILLGAFIIRLYKFNNPIADWHSWRQADTAAVSRNFLKYGFDVLHPRFDDLSNVPSGKDNPKGYRFVEFPIYNIAQAEITSLVGILTLEEWGRIVTIFSSLLSIIFIFLLVNKYVGPRAGLFSAFYYAFLPYSIYYGRTILPDPLMIMATLGGIYFFDKWIDESEKFKVKNSKLPSIFQNYATFLFSVIFTAVALLLKPFAIFFFLPMLVLAYNAFGLALLKKWQFYVFAILVVCPLILWRLWISQYPEGIPVNDWLFNGGNIRFKGAFFYWIFADRIGRLILGYWGLAIFVLGVLVTSGNSIIHTVKARLFFYTFLASTLLYVTVVARGNVQHDYYQIPIIPFLAIFLGIGSAFLLNPPKEIMRIYAGRITLLIMIVFCFLFGWYYIRDFYNINNRSIIIAGIAVDGMTPKNAKVIAPYEGDTSFLYQTNRTGWASFEKPLPEMIRMGADYLVLVNPNNHDRDIFGKDYTIVSSTPEYLLVKLK